MVLGKTSASTATQLSHVACDCSIYQVEGHHSVPFDGLAMNAVQRKVCRGAIRAQQVHAGSRHQHSFVQHAY
jgi:hypothetical protein